MSHKAAKKLRKKLSFALAEPVPSAVETAAKVRKLPPRLLMKRKDPISHAKAAKHGLLPGTRVEQGGAILHPMSHRAIYQAAKKGGLVG